tara:strand:- start:1914 stop:2378 length:465 start_codon:yes stop_codon:yes gene_type:complete
MPDFTEDQIDAAFRGTGMKDTLREVAEGLLNTPTNVMQCARFEGALRAYVATYPGECPSDGRCEAILRTVRTGNGMTAWESVLYALDDGRKVVLMVTDNDLSHPVVDDDEVLMGLYLHDADSYDIATRWAKFDNVAAALDAVQRDFAGVEWEHD